MKPIKLNPCVSKSPSGAKKGFALIVTLSLMILLTVIAVGLLSLSSISLRASSSSNAQMVARANARMAMMLAIGELQKSTGPDQRVTMTSGLQSGTEPANPNWAGATDVSPTGLTPDAKSATISWLVSGTKPDPTKSLTKSGKLNAGDALKIGVFRKTGSTTDQELLVPVVNVTQGNNKGRYAWWIGDEGTKARVDVAKPKTAPTTDRDKLAQYQSPLEAGWKNLGATWKELGPDGAIDKSALISLQTASLAAANKTLATEYFNDVTTGGFGLPTSVTDGGMKADLSLIFDRSQKTKKYGTQYFGTVATTSNVGGVLVNEFAVKTPSKFYLSDTISNGGSLSTGPNWGTLWNYAQLWQNVSNQQVTQIGVNPIPETDLRYRDWLPYTNQDAGSYRKDAQQTNSSITPVLSMLQMSFRLTSELAPPVAGAPAGSEIYKAQIAIQPVLGIWNPYNVTIKAAPYLFQWALYPYFRFNYAKPTGTGKYTDGRLTELWLRDEWTAGGTSIPTPEDPTGGKYFSMETDSVDLQPGEFRLFSVIDKVAIKAGGTYKLKSGWSEKGGFVVNLKAPDGTDRVVPKGYRAWFGDIVVQDTQSANTLARYKSLDTTKTSSTWFTLKSGGNVLLRSTDLWNGDSKSKIKVPEPVVSGSSGGLDTTKTTYLIEDLAGDKVSAHIATWSFLARTTLQVEEASQRLRNWTDSNPRAIITNPAWDGSKVDSSGNLTGWNFTSQLMGVYNPPGKAKQVGDGNGGNRGLLGEGGSAIPEPEVNKSGGRYQGFGGAANTLASGTNNVIVYDVPRAPLVSIGQFQHAQLSRYNFDPGFVVGNSYANPRIPLNATVNKNFTGVTGLNVTDISYEVNKKLWDSYFFSSLGLDYTATTGTSLDKGFDFQKLSSGQTLLPNPRMIFSPLSGDTTLDKILSENADRAPEVMASRILVKGAFNVNSTSKTAWKAVLSSLGASQLPVLNPKTGAATWKNPDGIRFNRFGHVITDTAYQQGGAGDDPAYWQGWRNLSDAELDKLAEEIVTEVKARGPFRSMAEFVNRNPNASSTDHQLKGPLQAALDRAINIGFPTSIGRAATNPNGSQFSKATTNENQSVGSASYLMQGDILQSLAPVLQVRSDYFKIRTCGEALDAAGNVTARAWCEAYVQRVPDYTDPTDSVFKKATELTSTVNKTFGRRYQIVSFRWLSSSEV